MKATHIISVVYFLAIETLELTWEDIETHKIAGLEVKVKPEIGCKIAEVVPPCVYYKAINKTKAKPKDKCELF